MFLKLNSAQIFTEVAHLQADEWVPWCQLLCTTLWTEGCPHISNNITSLGLQSCAAILHYVQIPHCSLVHMCPTWRPPGWVMWPMVTFVNYTYIHAIYIIQKFRQLYTPLIVILTHTTREPDHNNDCGPLPKMAGHPWYLSRSWKPLLHKLRERRHPPTTPQWSHPHSHLYTCPFHNRLCTYPPTPGHSPSIGSPTSLPVPCQV